MHPTKPKKGGAAAEAAAASSAAAAAAAAEAAAEDKDGAGSAAAGAESAAEAEAGGAGEEAKAAAAAAAAAAALPASVWVVRQHWFSPGSAGEEGGAPASKASSSSSTICAFRGEKEALAYALGENLTLVGTDPDLPHLLVLVADYAAAQGFDEESCVESLGPIPAVLAKPEDVEEDSAEALRERVDEFVNSIDDVEILRAFFGNIVPIRGAHATVQAYYVAEAQVF